MRVLEFTPDIPLEYGGGGMMRHIIGLSRHLRDAGHEVTIASARVPADVPLAPGFVRARGLSVVPFVRQTDIVHVHGGRMPEVALAAFFAWAFRKPFFYTPHAYYDTPPTLRPSLRQQVHQWLRATRKAVWDQVVERALLSFSSRTILLAPFWLDYLRTRRLPVGRVAIIPNAVDLASIEVLTRTPGLLGGTPSLLTVGRLDEVKHVDDTIRALTVEGMERAELHVVGVGPDRDRQRAVATREGVVDRVTWHGFVDDHHVAEMTAGAHAFVIASRQEGLPTAAIESLVRGTPVVASDIPPHRHILDVAGEATLYRLGDAEALARTALAVAGRSVDKMTRERVTVAFSWERNARLVLTLYEAALL